MLNVLTRVELQLGFGANKATLVFFVDDSTIRATVPNPHGESSPALVNPTSDIAKNAISDSIVRSWVPTLDGVAVSTALGNVVSFFQDFKTRYTGHIAFGVGSTHNAADTDNGLDAATFANVSTPAGVVAACAQALQRLGRHIRNDKAGAGTGTATTPYHAPSGAAAVAWSTVPSVDSVGSIADAYAAIGELFRAYEAHRVSTVAHGVADNTNSLTPFAGRLLIIQKTFAEAVAAAAGNTESGAATSLATYGAKVSPAK